MEQGINEKRKFNKGDFVKLNTYASCDEGDFSFGIYEGIDLNPNVKYSKMRSLALFYNHKKYDKYDSEVGYVYKKVLSYCHNGIKCERGIWTDKEDSSWSLCTEEEMERAIKTLEEHGFLWNKDTLELINKDTKEVVYKIIVPKNEYDGREINSNNNELKKKLKDSVISELKASVSQTPTYPNYNHAYGYGGNYDDLPFPPYNSDDYNCDYYDW